MIRFYANTIKQVSLDIYVAQINHKNFLNLKPPPINYELNKVIWCIYAEYFSQLPFEGKVARDVFKIILLWCSVCE